MFYIWIHLMLDFLFYLFAALTLFSGIMMIISRNTVNSAMYMILAFIGTAALFFLLEAYFLAIIQILIYSGAVVVLFLFVIMLLDVQSGARKYPHIFTFTVSLVGLLVLAFGIVYMFYGSSELFGMQMVEVADHVSLTDQFPLLFTKSVKSFGFGLFTKYMLPFQVAGFLLLLAMVGIIVISKKFSSDNK